MKILCLMIFLQMAVYGFSQEKPAVYKVVKPATSFMYHIDCYLDQDTLPTSFFKEIRSFALFNTNTDAGVDFSLSAWKLTVEDAKGKKAVFYSRKDNPNAFSLEMITAMQGKEGQLPKSIVFDSIRISRTDKSGTTSVDGGKAVFFRGKTKKTCH